MVGWIWSAQELGGHGDAPWGGVNVLLLMSGGGSWLPGKPHKPRPGQGQQRRQRKAPGRLEGEAPTPQLSLPVFIHSHLTVHFLMIRPVGSDFPTALLQLGSAQRLLQCKSKVPLYDI